MMPQTRSQCLEEYPNWNDRIFNIVIIENDTEFPKAILPEENYQFKHLKISHDIKKTLRSIHPDLVLLNLSSDDQAAQEICKSIKKSLVIPVIMVVEHKSTGIKPYADDIIIKPINKYELKFRIKNLLRTKVLYDQLYDKITQLEHAQIKLQELAITDALTGLYNYRHFCNVLDIELSRSKRQHLPVSLIMLDIDYFKNYNDKLGHQAGNEILIDLATLISRNVRRIDTVVRYGGEEFSLILPFTSLNNAATAAEKIRALVEEHNFPRQNVQPNQCITISCGIATFPRDAESCEQLIQIADKRLYQAKMTGRNKVVSGE